jgi:hypothetical protein
LKKYAEGLLTMVGQLLEYASGRPADPMTTTVLEHLDDMRNSGLHGIMEDGWDKMSD